jgi:hypothetical protein
MNIVTTEIPNRIEGQKRYTAEDTEGYTGIGMCIGIGDTQQEAIDDLMRQFQPDNQ